MVYLDDVLIYSKTRAEHEEHVKLALTKMREQQLYGNAHKCQFHADTVEYLGYIVSPKGISMDPVKTQAVRDWPVPRNLKEVQAFLGFANFYRRFITNFAGIAAPLTYLTRKDVPFRFDKKAMDAFE